MNRLDILKAARALIVERGLAKFTLKDYEGRFCAQGAINFAAGCEDGIFPEMRDKSAEVVSAADEARFALYHALPAWRRRSKQPEKYVATSALVDFNNAPKTTAEKVVDVFDKAIARAESEASS